MEWEGHGGLGQRSRNPFAGFAPSLRRVPSLDDDLHHLDHVVKDCEDLEGHGGLGQHSK